MTKIFAESILLAVPHICVSRIDKMKMNDFLLLLNDRDRNIASEARSDMSENFSSQVATDRGQIDRIAVLLMPL